MKKSILFLVVIILILPFRTNAFAMGGLAVNDDLKICTMITVSYGSLKKYIPAEDGWHLVGRSCTDCISKCEEIGYRYDDDIQIKTKEVVDWFMVFVLSMFMLVVLLLAYFYLRYTFKRIDKKKVRKEKEKQNNF